VTVLATVVASTALASGSHPSSTLNDVEPGLLGFLVVAGMGLVLVLLLRSMNKQFRKIGPAPEETEAEGASAAASRRPLRGLAAHRAALAAAEADARAAAAGAAPAEPDSADADRD
jgi:hypothetical protein